MIYLFHSFPPISPLRPTPPPDYLCRISSSCHAAKGRGGDKTNICKFALGDDLYHRILFPLTNRKETRCNRVTSQRTLGQMTMKSTRGVLETIRSSVRSFARTAHSSACSTLLASLTRSAVLTRSLVCSLRSLPPRSLPPLDQ